MRSPLDPLPRVVSTKSAVLIVALVVLGTGLAVGEYVRTTGPAPRTSSSQSPRWSSRPSEVRAASPRTVEDPARRIRFEPGASAVSAPESASESDRPAPEPTLFAPPSSSEGT